MDLKNETVLKYTAMGTIFGMCFPLAAILFLMHEHDVQFWQAYEKGGPLFWIIFSAPLVLGGVFSHLGSKQMLIEKLNHAFAELNNTKNFLVTTLDYMPGPVYTKDRAGNFLFANSEFYEVVPNSKPSVVGKNIFDVFPKSIAKQLHDNDSQIIKEGETTYFEEKVPHPDGSDHFYDTYKFPLKDENGNIYAVAGISLDITEKKLLEREIDEQKMIAHHQTKLAAIGELAAGVGHEINNPLAIIMGYLLQLERDAKNQTINDSTFQRIEKIQIACKRVADIVNGLRTFSRPSNFEKEVFSLGEAIHQTLALVKEIYHSQGVTIEFQNHSSNSDIYGNQSSIQQVIMNLISNSKDATSHLSDGKIKLTLENEGQDTVLSICDNGHGIEASIKENIFDAFFTTKEANKGTGIGLSLAANIVKEHGGSIELCDQYHSGAQFLVRFPTNNLSL